MTPSNNQNISPSQVLQDAPRFRVTYLQKLIYSTEVVGETYEEVQAQSENIYVHTNYTDYDQAEDHKESWEPLNEAAKHLLAEQGTQGLRKGLNLKVSQAMQVSQFSLFPAQPQTEKLAASFLEWKGERLSYTPSFNRNDPDRENQQDAEGGIAAHLDEEYEQFDLHEHTRWIVAYVAESFFQDVLSCPVEEMLCLMETLPEYLSSWQNRLASPNDGPNMEEAVQAGRDTLLLTLRSLWPLWVKVSCPDR